MEYEELKATLHQLHQQLRNGEPIDPQLAVLLQQISQGVNQLTGPDQVPRTGIAETEQKQSLLDRMLSLTEEFEETHPHLADAIGRVATALSRIGI